MVRLRRVLEYRRILSASGIARFALWCVLVVFYGAGTLDYRRLLSRTAVRFGLWDNSTRLSLSADNVVF